MSFEVIRESAMFNDGSFTTNWSTAQVTAGNTSAVRDGTRYRWIDSDNEDNGRYRWIEDGETTLNARYTGIQVTLYSRGEAVAMNRTSSAGGRGGTSYLGKDILGSVRSVSNENGQLEDRYEYDAFGKPYQGDLDNGMNLGYMGKPYDSNTGLYNYGYRDYKPEAARFTTVDPIRDGSNWFVYVNSDPINYLDMWGLKPGEIFSTPQDAAIDFANTYYDDSVNRNREYGSSVHKTDGGYTYTTPSKGSSWSVKSSVDPEKRVEANLHTHGSDDYQGGNKNNFSDQDIENADSRNVDSYVTLPDGTVQHYSPKTGWITDVTNVRNTTNNQPDPHISDIQNLIDNIKHGLNFPDQKGGKNNAPTTGGKNQ
jgi:RHS repeat-associated protein